MFAFSSVLLYFVWPYQNPSLFRIGALEPRWYGLLWAVSFFAGYYILRHIYRTEGRTDKDVDGALLYVMVGCVAGARLGHCLFYEPETYLSQPWRILYIWEGGLASHGAAIGILSAMYLLTRKVNKDAAAGVPDVKPQSFLNLADRVVITVALGGAIIRVANFLNAEILGTPTNLPWAVIFKAVDNVPRHPAMLYESAWCLVVLAVLWWLWKKNREKTPEGQLLGLFMAMIFGFRFFIEFIKESQVSWEDGIRKSASLDMGQILSIPFVATGIWLFIRAKTPKTGWNPE